MKEVKRKVNQMVVKRAIKKVSQTFYLCEGCKKEFKHSWDAVSCESEHKVDACDHTDFLFELEDGVVLTCFCETCKVFKHEIDIGDAVFSQKQLKQLFETIQDGGMNGITKT